MKNLNSRAFSLLEILMAALIFIITVGGIFATLSGVRTPVVNKEGALTAAVFGKQVLEALRSDVSQQQAANFYTCANVNANGTCGDFALSVGPHQVSAATLSTYGLSWPPALTAANPVLNYTVTCADGVSSDCTNSLTSTIAHRVDLNINW